MQDYIYIIYTSDLGVKLGEFNDIKNALIFIEAYYDTYYGEEFNLVISKQEKKQL